jgi:hypothetical protein
VAIPEERIKDGERMTTIVEFLEARLSEDELCSGALLRSLAANSSRVWRASA